MVLIDFKTIVNIVMKYCIDRDTAENIAQDILCYGNCINCAYRNDCIIEPDECGYLYNSMYNNPKYTDEEIHLYSKYITTWFKTHDEGYPALIDEWYENEYKEEFNE